MLSATIVWPRIKIEISRSSYAPRADRTKHQTPAPSTQHSAPST